MTRDRLEDLFLYAFNVAAIVAWLALLVDIGRGML